MALRHRRRAAAGFTLLETLVSLVLLMIALFLAADLLMEAGTLLADSAREVRDAPASLILARLRGDIMASGGFLAPQGPAWSSGPLVLTGHPQGSVQYEWVGKDLHRSVLDAFGNPDDEAVVWRGLTDWAWRPVPGWTAQLVEIDVSYRRFAVPRSPLPNLPRNRGPRSQTVSETLLVAPRAYGLGNRW